MNIVSQSLCCSYSIFWLGRGSTTSKSSTMMSPTTISTIPEELRQEITSYLNYDDAWSLKQTSKLFYHIVEIPTIKSFRACPYGLSLGMLEEWQIIPLGRELCHYCNRLLPKERFSRFQRRLTAARQDSLSFDYATWNPRKHYCLKCGVKNCHYPVDRKIYIGFGDPGCKHEAVVPCIYCGRLVERRSWDLRFYPSCNGLVGADELRVPYICNPSTSSSSSSSDSYPKMAFAGDKNLSKEAMEPAWYVYDKAKPEYLLALVGERLLAQSS